MKNKKIVFEHEVEQSALDMLDFFGGELPVDKSAYWINRSCEDYKYKSNVEAKAEEFDLDKYIP